MASAFGQTMYYDNFISYTTKDGLSQNDAMCIIQDLEGYIWIGTHDGLNRFDGYSFETFVNDNSDPNSIGCNLISDLALDKFGNIWISSWDNGISVYDKTTGTFHNYNNSIFPDLFQSDQLHTILVSHEGEIWVGGSQGLERLTISKDYKITNVTHYNTDPSNSPVISHLYINDLFQDSQGNIWVTTSRGLNRFINTADGRGQFIQYPELNNKNIHAIIEKDNGIVISAEIIYYISYQSINASAPTLKPLTFWRNSRNLIITGDNKMWGCTTKGVFVQDYSLKSRRKPHDFRAHWANKRSLSSDITTCVYEDNSGMIWIGTTGGGINKYNPKINFRHYTKTDNVTSLRNSKVRAIFEDSADNLWFGAIQNGTNVLTKEARKKSYEKGMLNGNNTPSLDEMHFNVCIDEMKLGNKSHIILGGGYPTFLSIGTFDSRNKKFNSRMDIPSTEKAVFSTQVIGNSLWLGTFHGGLYRYNFDDNGKFIDRDEFKSGDGTISSDIVRSLTLDLDSNLWIGTDNGLNKILKEDLFKKKPRFIQYFNDPEFEYSLSRNYILPIFVTSDNEVWIGTMGGGLNKVIKGDKGDNDQFLRYSTKDGLPNDVIKAILEDKDGSLWISTNNGITHFVPEELAITNYGLSSGLQDLEFGELAAWKTREGEMLFGGVNGFNAFYPSQIKVDTIPSKVTFDKLSISNTLVKVNDTLKNRVVLKQSLNQTKEIKLKHTENSFSLEMAALHYAAPEKNRYKYFLEGFDEKWITTDASNRIIRYTNLPSGEYTLQVKTSNSHGYWSNPKKLNIKIATAPWLSSWAFLAYGILFVIFVFLSRRFTLIRIENKNELVLKSMERQKSEELHQLKLKFFTNISHEFRTPLTLILGFTERLMDKSIDVSEDDRSTYYQKIYRNSKVLLNLVNQLLGFRKAEQGKMKIRASKNDLTNYIQLLGANFYELANQKEIDFNVSFPERIETWYDPEVIERIIFNLLSNAFKHTHNGGKIDIIVERNEEYVEISVIDNGEGIPEDMYDKIFERFNSPVERGMSDSGIGLSFVKTLVNLHHGQIIFDKNREEGTAFIVSIPSELNYFEESEIFESNDYEINEEEVNWLIPAEDDKAGTKVINGKKDKTILIVEDNEDIRFFIKENFGNEYNIFEAPEGGAALEICINNNIDLVISDLMMEGMDGLEFTDKLKSDERINHIPVIMLTAKDTPEDKLEGYSHGAEAYITKPFRIEELRTRMKTILQTRNNIVGKFRTTSTQDLSPSEVGMTSIDEKFLQRVMKYIEENISNSEFTIEMLAHECGLSQHHLNKKLKALVGSTANAFVRSIRLKRAAQLLVRNMYSVTEIMYEVGFNDTKYFRFCFKKEFGMTPTDYQREHSENPDNVKEEDEQ